MSANGIGALERGYRRTPQRETLELLATALQLNQEERRKLETAAGRPRSRLASGMPAAVEPICSAAQMSSDELRASVGAARSRHAERATRFIAIGLAIVALGWTVKSAWPSAAITPAEPSPSEVNDLEKSETAFWPAIYDTPDPQGSYAPYLSAKVGAYNGSIINSNAATWTTYFHGFANDSIVIQLNSQAQKLRNPTYVSIPIGGRPVIGPRKSYSVSAAIWFVGQTTPSSQGGYTIVSEGYPSPFVLRLNKNRVAEFVIQSPTKQLPPPQPWVTPLQSFESLPTARSIEPPSASDRVSLDGPVWFVVLGVYDSSTHVARLYVNGACKGARRIVSTLNAADPLLLGAREGRNLAGKSYVGDLFEGRIAQVMTFDHALTKSEAHTLYWIVRQNLYLPNAQIDPTPPPAQPPSTDLCDGNPAG
jgi:hypothetical protein